MSDHPFNDPAFRDAEQAWLAPPEPPDCTEDDLCGCPECADDRTYREWVYDGRESELRDRQRGL